MANIDYKKEIKVLEDIAQVDIHISVTPSEYGKVWDKEAKNVAATVTAPGFRKGFVPLNTVKVSHSEQITERAFNTTVNNVLQEVVKDIEQKPISTVRVSVDPHKDHEGDDHNHDIEFTVSYAYRIAPKLADFNTIKVARPKADISDAEIEQSLEMLLKSINDAPAKEGEEKVEYTEWSDEAVSKLNINDVKTLEDLKKILKGEIEKQKNYESEMQYRSDVIDAVTKASTVVVPHIVVEDMLLQQEGDYRTRIEKLGFEYEKYIEEKNVNMQELREEWKKLIIDDLSRELVMSQYVIDNNIEPTEEEIDTAVKNADQQLKDRYEPEALRQYMKYVLSNNIAFAKIYAIVSED